MIRALYDSGLGMTAQMKRLDVVANNIANADTTGFKRDSAVTQSFTEEYLKRINDPAKGQLPANPRIGKYSQGLFVDTVYTDFSAGSFRVTGGVYNFAISGEGFFTVKDKNGQERYTRDGAFTVTADRRLVTKDGFEVLDANGETITIPDGEPAVSEAGGITLGGAFIAQLRLVNFENPESLRKVGSNLYRTEPESRQSAFTAQVVQGALENSNVNAVREMVELININRIYDLNQRAVLNADQTMNHIANELGRKQ